MDQCATGTKDCVTPGIITIAKYYFFENKTIKSGLILEPRVNW